MALKNKSMYAILGILTLSPSTGYDIKKYSDTVLSGFWNENFGHIYPTLKKMLEDGMIEVVPDKNNEKKVLYHITEKGRKAFDAWLLQEPVPQPIRSELMLKLLFSSSQPKENTIRMLENYKQLHKNKIKKYMKMQKELQEGIMEITKERTCFMHAILRRGLLSGEAVVRWCDETMEDLRNC